MISGWIFKMSKHSDFHLRFFQIEGAWKDFTVVTKQIQNFKSWYGFRGRCLKSRDVCMDFEPYFKVHNLVSVHPKSIILSQMTNLNISFVWWCQFIDLLKFETRPSSLLNFGTANFVYYPSCGTHNLNAEMLLASNKRLMLSFIRLC